MICSHVGELSLEAVLESTPRMSMHGMPHLITRACGYDVARIFLLKARQCKAGNKARGCVQRHSLNETSRGRFRRKKPWTSPTQT